MANNYWFEMSFYHVVNGLKRSFYYVIIGLKSRPQKDAIAINLLKEDLMNHIVKPYESHEKFRCGDDTVVPDDISSIKITAGENFLRRGFLAKEQDYAEVWQTANQLKDVTDKFIKTPPQRKTPTKLLSKKSYPN